MVNKILFTFSAKFLTAAINFVLIILTAQFLGAEGRGLIGLFITTMVIMVLVNEIIGGPALVYLIPREDTFQLALPSYFWALIVCHAGVAILAFTTILPGELIKDLYWITLMYIIFGIHLTILLGKEAIKVNNVLTGLRVLLILLFFCIAVFIYDFREVKAYIYAMYGSHAVCLGISCYYVWPYYRFGLKRSVTTVIKKLLSYGVIAQVANLIQLMNYRVSYYFLNAYYGADHVGIYSVAINVAESIWLITNSIAMVQYARIANSRDKKYAQQITLALAKFSFVTTCVALAVLLFLPESVYRWVFGEEFGAAGKVVLYLAPGIAAFGLSTIFSHYFSGLGKYHINAVSSVIGLIATLVFCVWLIPQYHFIGAGMAASASYLAATLYLTWKFMKDSGSGPADLIPSKEDVVTFVNLAKTYYVRHSGDR